MNPRALAEQTPDRRSQADTNGTPRVSVVMIFLNGEQFIEEAIQSVFAQTYSQWELLLVDDGSQDRSTEIARRYAATHPERVRYVEHPGHENRGMSASRNLGLRHARGEYIAFLDADDVYLPEKLERQVALLDAHPDAGMVYGATQYWYSWTGRVEDQERDRPGKLGVAPDRLFQPPTLLTRFLQDGGTVPCICGLIARRELLQQMGGSEENFRGMYEDQVLLAKLCLTAPVYVESGCWERYRQHPESACSRAESRGEVESKRLDYLRWVVRYLSEQQLEGSEVWDKARRELWRYEHPRVFRFLYTAKGFSRKVRRAVRQLLPALAPR